MASLGQGSNTHRGLLPGALPRRGSVTFGHSTLMLETEEAPNRWLVLVVDQIIDAAAGHPAMHPVSRPSRGGDTGRLPGIPGDTWGSRLQRVGRIATGIDHGQRAGVDQATNGCGSPSIGLPAS